MNSTPNPLQINDKNPSIHKDTSLETHNSLYIDPTILLQEPVFPVPQHEETYLEELQKLVRFLGSEIQRLEGMKAVIEEQIKKYEAEKEKTARVVYDIMQRRE